MKFCQYLRHELLHNLLIVGQVATERNVPLLFNAKLGNRYFNAPLRVEVKEILNISGEDFISSLCQKHFL
jgi:hypothetical protein